MLLPPTSTSRREDFAGLRSRRPRGQEPFQSRVAVWHYDVVLRLAGVQAHLLLPGVAHPVMLRRRVRRARSDGRRAVLPGEQAARPFGLILSNDPGVF